MKKEKNKIEDLKKKVEKLFSLIGSKAEFEIKEEEDFLVVDIDAKDETGLMIGRRGETVNSFQTLISLMARQVYGDWKRVSVNVGDWREKQEERLKEMATQTAERAIETGDPQPIYNLTSSQRRVIHLFLSERGDIETESTGEGRDRYLLVKPKAK